MKNKILVFCLMLVSAALFSVASAQDINLSGYTLAFDDEFSTSSITTANPKGSSNWYALPPNGAPGYFSESNWNISAFSVSGGILTDSAYYSNPAIGGQNWQSGYIASVDTGVNGFKQQYGYFEIRCQMPDAGTGAWPSFWLDSVSGITGGSNEEIDVFEWYGVCDTPGSYQDYVSQASHNWNSDGSQNTSLPYLYAPQTPIPNGTYPWQGYHIYGCQIDPVHITWYVDGTQTNQIATPTSYVNNAFYVMVDYALGGGWSLSGSPFTTDGTSSLLVDWVRVYSLPSGGSAPSAPTNLTATPGNAQVSLSWTASSGATSYNIYRGTSSGNESTTVATGVTSTSYTNTGLTNGTMYYYRITATNSSGTSGYSNEATATPTAGSGGSQLIGLQYQTNGGPLIGSLSAGAMAQSGWNVSSLPYVVNGTYSVSNMVTSTGTSSGISESTTSYGGYDSPRGSGFASGTGNYDLFGGFALGSYNGVPNITVTLTGLSASTTYTLLTYVGSSSATDVISGSVNVSGATTYYMKGAVSNTLTQGTATSSASAGAGNYFKFSNITGVTSMTFTLTDTGGGTADLYGLQLAASSSGGGGSAPAAPTNLTASAGNAQVALNWTASSGATTYSIYRGTSSGNEVSVATGVTSTSYTNTGLTNGTMYYFKVAAVNSYGTSGLSNEATATPTAGGGGSQTVGVQYQTNGSPLIGSLSAGVISQSNWNVSSLPYVTNGTYSLNNLTNSTGTASGISESTVSYGGYDHPSGSGFASGTGNNALFGGYALGSYNGVPNVTVTLTGLTASKTYTLVTYVGSSSTTDIISVAINVSGATTYYIKGAVSNVLTQGTATTSGSAAAGNYFKFTGITGVTSVTYTLTDTGSNTACLYGLQVSSN